MGLKDMYPPEPYQKPSPFEEPSTYQTQSQYDKGRGESEYRTPSGLGYQGSNLFQGQIYQPQGLPSFTPYTSSSQYQSTFPAQDFGTNPISPYNTSYAPSLGQSYGKQTEPYQYHTQDPYQTYPAQGGHSNQGPYPRQGRGSPVYEPSRSDSHSSRFVDCPERGCDRVGAHALKGKDNLADHLRKAHGKVYRK